MLEHDRKRAGGLVGRASRVGTRREHQGVPGDRGRCSITDLRDVGPDLQDVRLAADVERHTSLPSLGWFSTMTLRPRLDQVALGQSDRRQIEDVLGALRDVLGPALIGAYLHGSAVLGGLHAHSDIDVLAVAARKSTRSQKEQLISRLLVVSGRDPATASLRPIELTVVIASEVRPWRYPPRRDLQFGEWLREGFVRRDPRLWRPATDPDLAILVTMVLLGEVVLAGPPASEVFDPVPRADFVDALLAGIPGLIADLHSDTRNVVLTLARNWNGVVTGGVLSKDAAAEWALPRLPAEHRAVLTRARDIYLGIEEEHWEDLQETVPMFANAIVAEIRGSIGQSPL